MHKCKSCGHKKTIKKKKEKKIAKVMHEFKDKELHSGSKKGPLVKNPKQAIAIAISESKKIKSKKSVVKKNKKK